MREAQRQLQAGASTEVAHQAAKQTGAFAGAMRPNLIGLLDHIGLHRWLGLASCDALFNSAGHLVQTTSILRHPLFVDGKNYNGTPNMVRSSFLRAQIEAHFAEEARALEKAVFVPLGAKVSEGLDWLAQRGVIPAERILHGLPHPSGANAERIAYFLVLLCYQPFSFPPAARTPIKTGKQCGSKLQSQRCDRIRHMALLTQGRPGAGSLRVRKGLRRITDELEFFFAHPGVR
jgi:hypothetical protein